MKWVLITHDYPPKQGGVARYLEALVQTCPCVVVEALQRLPGRLVLLWFVYNRMKRSDGIVTSHVLPIGTMCCVSSLILKKPYVVILHGMDFDLARRSPWKHWLLKKILSNASKIVTNSHALDKEVSTFTRRLDIEVVYPSVSDGFIESAHFIHAKHQKHDQLRLLTVSRLVERKGHMKVLELVKDDPTLHYTIVGDGIMKQDILAYIEEHGLQDRVELLTTISDRKLPDLYAKADVFVMPVSKTQTDREGFGIVYLEAQLFQLPVIAVRHPGVDEALIDGQTGFLIDDTKEALAMAVAKLKDATLRKQLGLNATMFVKDHFARETQFKQFCKILGCG